MNKSKPRKAGESTSKNASVKIRITKRNKLINIKKALGNAGGIAIEKLQERLRFWEGK